MFEGPNVDIGDSNNDLVTKFLVDFVVGFERLFLFEVLALYFGYLVVCSTSWMDWLCQWIDRCYKLYIVG